MFSFKDFLIESRSAPLYHGTSATHIKKILLDREGLAPNTYISIGDSAKRGVSLTRNYRFAKFWFGVSSKSVVLILDQQKISQRFKIVPYNYSYTELSKSAPARYPGISNRWDSWGDGDEQGYNRLQNAYEEFVITDNKIPVNCIVGIEVRPNFTKHYAGLYDKILKMYGNSFIRVMGSSERGELRGKLNDLSIKPAGRVDYLGRGLGLGLGLN